MPPPKDQDAIVRQFREELVNEDLLHDGDSIGTDDHVLLRFLRARQFNIKQAKVMWKNCYEWRRTAEGAGIDELYRQIDPFDYPERDHVFKFWPLFFHKTDKRGRPLNIHHFGRINTTELYKNISPERFWQAFLVNAESLTREVLPASSSAAGKHIDGTFVIVDLKGFGTGQFWQMKHLARGAFQVSQDYFPETMSQLAIINAPSSFTAIWAVMRPWLAKETVAKVSVLGSNYASALLQLVDAENLPSSLGGSCTCSDCDDKETEEHVEKGGQTEMGRCAFSNAGPWLIGRKERREGWLKGERDIALSSEDIVKFSTSDDKQAGALSSNEQSTEPPASNGAEEATEKKEQHEHDDVTSAAGAGEETSDDTSTGPSTPGLDSVQQHLGQVQIDTETETTQTMPITLDEPTKALATNRLESHAEDVRAEA